MPKGTRGVKLRGSPLIFRSKAGNGGQPAGICIPLAPERISRGVFRGKLSARGLPSLTAVHPRYFFGPRDIQFTPQSMTGPGGVTPGALYGCV